MTHELINAVVTHTHWRYEGTELVENVEFYYVESVDDEYIYLLNIDGTPHKFPTCLSNELEPVSLDTLLEKLNELKGYAQQYERLKAYARKTRQRSIPSLTMGGEEHTTHHGDLTS